MREKRVEKLWALGLSSLLTWRQRTSALGGFLLLLLLFAVPASAQAKPVRWSTRVPEQLLRAGDRFELTVTAAIESGWHIYSITQPAGGPSRTEISIPTGQPFQANGPVKAVQPQIAFDPNFEMKTETYEQSAEFIVPAIVAQTPKGGKSKGVIDVSFQACNETTCMPPAVEHIPFVLKVVAASAAAAEASIVPQLSSSNAPAPTVSIANAPMQQRPDSQPVSTAASSPVSRKSLRAFLWLSVMMGALSLVTPCVFPMIPITVSYFANHAGGERRSAIMTALVYCLGIILTFTAIGMLLAVIFGASGVNQLAANPWVNLFITLIFLGFAFSLFGAYFIQVPSGPLQKVNALSRNEEDSRMLGALLMGFTFTLTSFTCTAPFVGTLLVMTAEGNWRWPLLGMLTFSTIFAIPFFVLALVPQMMSRLPRAGGWMVSVKVVMGFLEIAAAMKFLSNADLVWRWGIFTRQVVLAVWIAIAILIVLYVMGYFRVSHDNPVESVGVARITVAVVFLAIAFWMLPGLFGKQLGELESFLPPEISASGVDPGINTAPAADASGELAWIVNDYDSALAKAKQENKLVFVDFTGYTCTNCRWMESNMFPRSEVAKEMKEFVRVRLYTDGDDEKFKRQQKMQQERFGTVALPYYAILRADGSKVATYAGLTRNASEFVAFLREAE